MKLTYRGQSYEYNPPKVETTENNSVGKYRGQDWRFRNLKKAPVLQPSYNLTYRGVKYTNGTAPIAQNSEASLSVAERARELMLKRERATLQREHAMFNRLADQIGLDANSGERYNPAW